MPSKPGPLSDELRARYAPPRWALFFEVADSTGMGGQGRRLDAVVVDLYPSRGLEVHGVEVKVQRSDLLRELRDPSKSEAVARHCDRFWIATPHDGVVKGVDELPTGWGWLRLSPKGELRTAKKAPQNPARRPGDPLNMAFAAALLRRAAEAMARTPDAVAVERAVEQARLEWVRVDRSNRDHELEYARDQASRARKRAKELEDLLAAFGWEASDGVRRRMEAARRLDVDGLATKLRGALAALEKMKQA